MPPVALPIDHPKRRPLAEELHARPATPIVAPAVMSCLALFEADAERVFERVAELARRYAVEPPSQGSAHALIELPGGRMKWERHGEFTSLVFVKLLPGVTLESMEDFPSAFDLIPGDWLASLNGRVMAQSDIVVVTSRAELDVSDLGCATKWFVSDALAGSRVLDGAAWIFTDFKLKHSGGTRVLVVDVGLGDAQTARVAQRMVEVELYRMMGLLAFPMARTIVGDLRRIEQQLAETTDAMATISEGVAPQQIDLEERQALDRLTRIAAEVERSVAATMFRFSAAQAYFGIVRARVTELREERVGDMRTLQGFLARRLTPAMDTIDAAALRQEALANRIERASALLLTRVDLTREEQNQSLLTAMERRGKLQLNLQQTVEKLSVAAITYYVVALIGYATKPLHLATFTPERVCAVSIPFVAYAVWRFFQRGHRE